MDIVKVLSVFYRKRSCIHFGFLSSIVILDPVIMSLVVPDAPAGSIFNGIHLKYLIPVQFSETLGI